MTYSSGGPRLASPKQIAFLQTLLAERTIPEADAAWVGARITANTLSIGDASDRISAFLAAPRKPIVADGGANGLAGLLALVPVSRYAIPVNVVESWLTETDLHGNDHLFVAVEKGRYGASKGRLFLNRLGGSVGGFTRRRLAPEDALTVAKFLGDPDNARTAAQTFGRLHNQCGVCGADLTDLESRRLALGPTCRQRFGL